MGAIDISPSRTEKFSQPGGAVASAAIVCLMPPPVPPASVLQGRINRLFQLMPEDRARSTFSEYRPEPNPIAKRLMVAAAPGGAEGIAAALDVFERLAETEDRVRLQHSLAIVLTHHPDAARLGLRVPSLAERAPWMAAPSRPTPES